MRPLEHNRSRASSSPRIALQGPEPIQASGEGVPTVDPSRVHVREARAADIADVLHIRRIGAQLAFARCIDRTSIFEALVDERVDPGKLERELADPNCHVFVAILDDRVVGTAQLDVEGDAGEMSACSCAIRGHGIGSALMRARIAVARDRGLRKVWLETDTVNPNGMAHAIRHGFRPVESRPGMRIPGNRVVLYERSLCQDPRKRQETPSCEPTADSVG